MNTFVWGGGGTHLDEVLWGEGLKDRHKEVDHVLIGGVLALEQEVLVM